MSICPDSISQYANADWTKQYLASDGKVCNRTIVSIWGLKIDLAKIAGLFVLQDQANIGFSVARQNVLTAISQNEQEIAKDKTVLNTYLRAIEKLNRLHAYVNDCAEYERIQAPLIDDQPLEKYRGAAPAGVAPQSAPENVPSAMPETRQEQPTAISTRSRRAPVGKSPAAKQVEEAPIAAKPKASVYTLKKRAKVDKEAALQQLFYQDYLRQKTFWGSLDSYKLEEEII